MSRVGRAVKEAGYGLLEGLHFFPHQMFKHAGDTFNHLSEGKWWDALKSAGAATLYGAVVVAEIAVATHFVAGTTMVGAGMAGLAGVELHAALTGLAIFAGGVAAYKSITTGFKELFRSDTEAAIEYVDEAQERVQRVIGKALRTAEQQRGERHDQTALLEKLYDTQAASRYLSQLESQQNIQHQQYHPVGVSAAI